MVSVIIPAYNVENWVEKCLYSVIEQSYRDIEIIIVNDGSTDSTMKICSLIAERDSRIKLISQQNKGLSEARNEGLRIAMGEYVTFVDSDDYLDKYAIEKAVENIAEADICIFQYACVDETGKDLNKRIRNNSVKEYNGNQALAAFFTDEGIGGVVAWAKLYKKSLFDNNDIWFPANKYHEDCFTTYKLISCSKKVIYSPHIGYFYLQRPNSIVHSSFNVKYMDKVDAADECIAYVQKNNPEIIAEAESAVIHWYLQVANRIYRSGEKNTNYIEIIQKKISGINFYSNPYLTMKYKMLCSIFVNAPMVYRILLKIFKPDN